MNNKKLGLVVGLVTLTIAVGCSEAKEDHLNAAKVAQEAVVIVEQAAEEAPVVLAQAVETTAVVETTASVVAPASPRISGKVAYDGEQPALKKLNMDADPVCQGLHAEVVRSETVLVNSNGTLRNVFVYVKKGLEGQTFPPATKKAIFNQIGCTYKPHVLGVRVGQPVEILNSDATLHNVHALAKENPEFNYGMPFEGMTLPAQFNKSEMMIKMKCDVHPWMSAYIGVVDHPYYAVTGEKGNFDLGELPAGEYTIEAWHEYYGTQTQKVTVPSSGEVVFTFRHSKDS